MARDRKRWHRTAAAACALGACAIAACILPDIELYGRPCDGAGNCIAGYSCDRPKGASDGGRCWDPSGAIHVDALDVAWTTPHQALLRWDLAGGKPLDDTVLDRVFIKLRSRKTGVERIVDSRDNAELDVAFVTEDGDASVPVRQTLLRDLEALTTYDAELFVSALGAERPIAVATTTIVTLRERTPTECVAVFPEHKVGFAIASVLDGSVPGKLDDGGGPDASPAMRFVARADLPPNWYNAKLGGLVGVDTSALALDPGYLSLWIAVDDVPEATVPYGEVHVMFREADQSDWSSPSPSFLLKVVPQRLKAFVPYELSLAGFVASRGGGVIADFEKRGISQIMLGTRLTSAGKVSLGPIRLCP